MPATRYKIWAKGNHVGRGAMESLHVGIAGVAKKANAGLPFAVANELICGHLARAILLPVPPGFIIEQDGAPWYVSLNFNLAGEDLPPVNAGALIRAQPRVACGIVLFDIWVVNIDRNNVNLAFDQSTNRVQIFDHGHAFYHTTNGQAYLQERRDQLGVAGHCLIGELNSVSEAMDWLRRIRSVPEFYIKEVVQAAVEVGLPSQDRVFCTDYLLDRRERLVTLLKANRTSFPKVVPTLWDELNEDGGVQ